MTEERRHLADRARRRARHRAVPEMRLSSLTAANDLGLRATVNDLVALTGTQDLSRVGAALVHVSLDRRLRASVLED